MYIIIIHEKLIFYWGWFKYTYLSKFQQWIRNKNVCLENNWYYQYIFIRYKINWLIYDLYSFVLDWIHSWKSSTYVEHIFDGWRQKLIISSR